MSTTGSPCRVPVHGHRECGFDRSELLEVPLEYQADPFEAGDKVAFNPQLWACYPMSIVIAAG